MRDEPFREDFNRRDFLGRVGIIAGAAWSVPVIVTLDASPASATPAPAPKTDDATIVCDGEGGYRPDLRGWTGAQWGIEECIRIHENSHAEDWLDRFGASTGKADGADIPLGEGPEYDEFLRQSECTAYNKERTCIQSRLATETDPLCRAELQAHLEDIDFQLAKHGC